MPATTRASRQQPKEAPKPPRPPVHKKPHEAGVGPGSSAFAAFQRALGNRAAVRLVQRDTLDPAARAALLTVAKQQMEEGARLALLSVGLSAQLMAGPMNLPGSSPATDPSTAASASLLNSLQAAGSLLDSGIATFQQAGGELADIEHMLRLRARVSNALFWAAQSLAGNAAGGPLAGQELIRLPEEWNLYQAAEGVRAARAVTAVPGALTMADALQAQVKSIVLRQNLLLPLGSVPIPL